MIIAAYLRYSDLFEKKTHFQTLKKKLKQLRRSSVISNLSAINNLYTHSEFLNSSQKDFPVIQKDLKENYLSPSIQLKILQRNFQNRTIFTRLQNLFLTQLSILNSSEDNYILADGFTPGGYNLGEACLMASDYLVSPKEERNTASGTKKKIIRHLGFQIAPLMEINNPLDIMLGIVRSEVIYSKILQSTEFRQSLLSKNLSQFDISSEFEKATKISLVEYIDITLAILFSLLFPEGGNIKQAQDLTLQGFLRYSSLNEETFKRYLKLETKSIEKFKSNFRTKRNYLKQFSFIPSFKSHSLLEIVPNHFICIDTFFLTEKLNSGIYWKVFDNLPKEKKETFFEVFGYLFELYVRNILQKFTAKNNHFVRSGLLFSSPEYQSSEECFDEIIYFPETKHLIVIECKSSFMHSEAKYGGSIRRFEKEIRKKFIEKEDGTSKGIGQLAKHIGRLFHLEKGKRSHLKNPDFDFWIQGVEKISPVLITQEPIISFHIIEEMLNSEFNKALKKQKLRIGVKTSQLTVIDIETLEFIKPHLESGAITFEQCINARNYRDPNYKTLFRSFVSDNFKIGQNDDEEVKEIFDGVVERIKQRFFDKDHQERYYSDNSFKG